MKESRPTCERAEGARRVLLLLPTTTYRTSDFMQAAAQRGVLVTVGSESPSTMTGLNPTGLITLPLSNPDLAAQRVAQFAAQHPISAVIAVDDQVVVAGAAICQMLKLPTNSVESATVSRNKHRMRELLHQASVPQPRFALGSFDASIERDSISFPCVVKPVSLAGSQGVMRVDTLGELDASVARLRNIVHAVASERGEKPTDHFLIEQFVPGPEVAVEGLLSRGKLRVLAIFDKPDPMDGPFFEETMYVTPSRMPADVQQQIAETTAAACRAIGLVHGPVHAELRLPQLAFPQAAREFGRAPQVIEVNARSIGGLCSRVLRFGTGLSLEEIIVQHAIEPDWLPPDREREAAGVMMIPIPRAGVFRQVDGLDGATAVPGIENVVISARVGQQLVPLPEGSLYLGFIFARGSDPAAVEQSLRGAHAQLAFAIE